METIEAHRKNIVVLGAGFGGITAIIKLYRRLKRRGELGRYQLILVSKNAQHLYTPALYEIASIPKGEAGAVCLKSSICIQIEEILASFPGIKFIGEEVGALDPQERRIIFESGGVMPFEYAVIALGAETNFFNIPGLKEHSYPLKTFEDAVRLRNRVEELVKSTSGRLKIIVGGAGATGVELSAEFVNLLGHLKKRMRAWSGQAEIILIEAAPEILAGFSLDVIRRARQRLRKLGIKILTGKFLNRVTAEEVIFANGSTLPYQMLVWAGGVRPAEVLKKFGLELDKKGGVVVNEFLEAKERIYAIGDCASFTPLQNLQPSTSILQRLCSKIGLSKIPKPTENFVTGFIHPKTKKPVGGNVPVAEAEARIAAKNIVRAIAGERPASFRPLANYPFILAVGGKYALTDLVILKFSGFLGWTAKQLVELRYLLFILPWGKAFRMWLRAVYYATRND